MRCRIPLAVLEAHRRCAAPVREDARFLAAGGRESRRPGYIHLRGFIDRFDRVLPEQVIAPGNEIVEVLHDHRFLVRHRAQPGDQVRVERIIPPPLNLVAEFGIIFATSQAAQQPLDALALILGPCPLEEWLGYPVALGNGVV